MPLYSPIDREALQKILCYVSTSLSSTRTQAYCSSLYTGNNYMYTSVHVQ